MSGSGSGFGKAVWGAAIALFLLTPVDGAAGPHGSGKHSKLDGALEQRLQSGGDDQDVIVRSKPGKKDSIKKKVARQTSRLREYSLIDAVSARLNARQIREFAEDSDVDGVSLDADVEGSGGNSTSTATASVVKQMLGVGDWFTGSSLTVAVIDSGIAPGADFDTRILGMYDFTNGKAGVLTVPFDDYGHGTHVAGLIGSSGSSSAGAYAGVAPGVKMLAVKVLDRRGVGRTSDVINALQFVVANRAAFGVRVVNLSLGHPIYESAKTDPLVLAVEAAVRSGLVVVVAAGNYGTNLKTGVSGYAGIASPGNAPSAITVGAANTNGTVARSDDRLAPYSSRGPSYYDGIAKPDVLAPGHSLVSADASGSTLETTYPNLVLRTASSKYLKLSGSSMATGVVSGLIAVAIEASDAGAQQRWQDYQNTLKRSQRSAYVAPPPLTSNALKAMLQFSATRLRDEFGVPYGPLEQGTGLVNGQGLVILAYYTDRAKAAGQFWLNSPYGYSTAFGSVEEPWSQQIVWGTRFLGGTSLVEIRQVAWAQDIAWGTGEEDNVTWGTAAVGEEGNVVWGTSADEDNVVWGTSIPITTDLTWAGNVTEEDNVVWGTTAENWDGSVVWGTALIGYFDGATVIWGALSGDEDNVVWGTLDDDNVVWGTTADKVTVLGVATGGAL